MGGLAAYPRVREDHKMTHHDKTKIGSDCLSAADLFSFNALLVTKPPQPLSIQAS